MNNLLLRKEEIKKIHTTSVDILGSVGIKLQHDELFNYISNFNGVKVNGKKREVRFSPDIIEDSINKAKKKFKLYGRDKNKSADFGYGNIITSSSWGMPFKIDIAKNKKITALTADLINSAIVCDYLENIDIVGCMFRPNEIPSYYRDIYEYAETIKRTTKPVGVWIKDGITFKYIIEIYKLFLDDAKDVEKYPPFFYEFENISPLVFHHDGVDILYNCAKHCIPMGGCPIPQPMTTGPVTIAGSLALGNAEQLAALVLTQLVKPGLPYMFGLMANVPDPFTLVATFTGAPENVLLSIGEAQLAHYYGFPIFLANQITCSNQIDYQMGAEVGINSFACLILNADLYGHLGIVGPDQGASIIKLIIDEEAISYIKRIKEGFKVDDNTLASNVIKEVGIGGNFLLSDHTLKNMRSEYWVPKVFNRDSYTVWSDKGSKSLINRTIEYRDHILKNHRVEELNIDIIKEINKIVESAKRDLLK